MTRQLEYTIAIANDQRRSLAIAWLWLAVLTLLGAGVFSVLLVLARTPIIGEMFPFTDFFHTALVIHVNLSSLLWILSFASALWTLNSRVIRPRIASAIFMVVLAGALVMVLSPFTGSGRALMSNYIPVLDDYLFLAALVIFGCGIGLQVLFSMSVMHKVGERISGAGVIRFGLNCAAIGIFVALAAFITSWLLLPPALASEVYYELLFWSGGHVLQFSYTLLMMVAWLWLASSAGLALPLSPRVALFLFGIGLLAIFLTPLIYFEYAISDPLHRRMFTRLMSFGGSLSTFPMALAILLALFRGKARSLRATSAQTALFCSLFLFGVGGFMGFLIDGNNVSIPAHYHGCIVGVSLSLMGVCYQLLPRLGCRRVNFRLSLVQLWLYASGQFLHIAGLLWSGGYGVERKVAGAEQWLNSVERVAGMGLMGFGGLLSACGGFLFIIIVIRALLSSQGKALSRAALSG